MKSVDYIRDGTVALNVLDVLPKLLCDPFSSLGQLLLLEFETVNLATFFLESSNEDRKLSLCSLISFLASFHCFEKKVFCHLEFLSFHFDSSIKKRSLLIKLAKEPAFLG